MAETVKRKKPIGFYVCSLTFTFERMAYYTAKWLIAVFVVAQVVNGGLGMDKVDGAKMSANLVAFTYIAPLVGGYICDRWLSPRLAIFMGALLMGAGYFVGWQTETVTMCYIMIFLVSIGTGLFKGNLSGITGRLFDNAEDLDGAFSIQYSFINLGSFIGTTFIALLATAYGFRETFFACGIIMIIGALWWAILAPKFLGDIGKKPFKANEGGRNKEDKASDTAPLTNIEKKRVAAIILVTLFSVIFWTIWYLAYNPVYYYWGPDGGAAPAANWVLGDFTIPTSWFDSVNAFCCMAFGPILAIVWSKLASGPKGDLSMFRKTALGISILGGSFIYMAVLDITRGGAQINIMFIALFGVILTLGEMVFSPLGNSFINKFAPAKILGTLLGVWPIAIFFAGKGSGYLFEVLTALQEKTSFALVYGSVGAFVLVCGIILWGLDKKLSTLVED